MKQFQQRTCEVLTNLGKETWFRGRRHWKQTSSSQYCKHLPNV